MNGLEGCVHRSIKSDRGHSRMAVGSTQMKAERCAGVGVLGRSASMGKGTGATSRCQQVLSPSPHWLMLGGSRDSVSHSSKTNSAQPQDNACSMLQKQRGNTAGQGLGLFIDAFMAGGAGSDSRQTLHKKIMCRKNRHQLLLISPSYVCSDSHGLLYMRKQGQTGEAVAQSHVAQDMGQCLAPGLMLLAFSC